MWNNNRRTSKTVVIIVVCFLAVWIAGCGNGIGGNGGDATTVTPPHSYSVLPMSLGTMHTLSMLTTNAATFAVTGIDMSVTPTTTATWKCGSYIQVVYNAVFHVVSGPSGGTIVFSYTTNNGRSQTFEKLTILPGQRQSNFVFTWQGSLSGDHVYPGLGGVLVTSPNYFLSRTVSPAYGCK